MNVWTAEKIILLGFLLKGVECKYLKVTLPNEIDALSGSFVLIKCTFEMDNSKPYENPEGLWIEKRTQTIVFNSSMSSPVFKGSIIGKLKENNCTTIFYDISSNHSGTYYFTFKTMGELYKSSAYIFINVIESPPPPTVMFYPRRRVAQNSPLLEGSSVILRCSAKTLYSSRPPVLTWSSNPKLHLSESSRLEEQNQTQLLSDLNFNVTHLHHRVNFICTITYQLQDKKKTAQTNYTSYVHYAPKISPSSSCKRADVTVCFCEVNGNPFPNLAWYLSENPVTNSTCTSVSEERLGNTVLRSTFTLSYFLTTEHSVQCVATNIYGNSSQQFHLDPLSKETAYCEHKTLPLLITLALVVLLYAVTVGAGFYKIKQLSTKLKAKREAEALPSVQRPPSNNIYENLNF